VRSCAIPLGTGGGAGVTRVTSQDSRVPGDDTL